MEKATTVRERNSWAYQKLLVKLEWTSDWSGGQHWKRVQELLDFGVDDQRTIRLGGVIRIIVLVVILSGIKLHGGKDLGNDSATG